MELASAWFAKAQDDLAGFSKLHEAVDTLNNYYTDTRYPDIWDYARFEDKKLAEEALRFAEEVLTLVRKKRKS